MSKTTKKNKSRFAVYGWVLLAILLTTVVLFLFFTIYSKTQPKIEPSQMSQPTFLYVQTAHSGTLSPEQADGRRILKLNNVSPTTVYFSDRPSRITGHESTAEFIAQWSDGADSFASNPPNAALDIIGEHSQSIAIVELLSAKYDLQNKTLEYEVIILDNETDGMLPQSFDEVALFIDAAWKEYYCNCDPAPGSNDCDCKYKYTLGKSSTKEFRGFCKKDVTRPVGIGITGLKKSTTCTIRIFQDVPYVTRSCTNWSPTSRDELNIKVKCKNY